MKVVALVPEAFGGHGGIALYCRDLLTAFAELPIVEQIDALPRLIRKTDKSEVVSKLNFRKQSARGGVFYFWEFCQAFISRPRYKLVVCGHINLLLVAVMLGWWHKAPLVLFIYGVDAWYAPNKRRYLPKLLLKVDHVVSISEFTGRRFIEWSGFDKTKVSVLPNAIHIDSYGLGQRPLYLEQRYGLSEMKVILTLGRIDAAEQYKGFDEVLDIMTYLVSEDSSIRYLIAGDGNDISRLQNKAKQLGIEDYVVFAGLIDEEEKADHYRLADAFVMAGRGEGFGFVYLEAMACGTPVVASSLDGSREAVRHGELGAIVDPDDVNALKSAIRSALARKKHIPQGLDYFSYRNFKDRLATIINQVVIQEEVVA